jgi:hypothetical protein|nr:MAG TPA: hypothetical protein [Caudoviricetes sp.]
MSTRTQKIAMRYPLGEVVNKYLETYFGIEEGKADSVIGSIATVTEDNQTPANFYDGKTPREINRELPSNTSFQTDQILHSKMQIDKNLTGFGFKIGKIKYHRIDPVLVLKLRTPTWEYFVKYHDQEIAHSGDYQKVREVLVKIFDLDNMSGHLNNDDVIRISSSTSGGKPMYQVDLVGEACRQVFTKTTILLYPEHDPSGPFVS